MHPDHRRPHRRHLTPRLCAALLAALICVFVSSAHAQSVAEALAARMGEHDQARRVQREIDALAGRRESLAMSLDDQRLAEDLARARAQLQAEQERRAQLTQSIEASRDARAGLIPLLEQMLDLVADSIALDLPFDVEARLAAIEQARSTLTDATVGAADRFDAVFDVYRRELRLSYTSEQRRATVNIDGQERLVTLLRIGRVGLYAVSDDVASCHVFSRERQDWRALTDADCVHLDAVRDDPALAVLGNLPLSVPRP